MPPVSKLQAFIETQPLLWLTLKSRLGIFSEESPPPQKAGAVPTQTPPCPPFHLELLVGSALIGSIPDSISYLVHQSLSKRVRS